MRFSGTRSWTEVTMPDNASFYHISYVVAIAVYLFYAFSIHRRTKGLGNPK